MYNYLQHAGTQSATGTVTLEAAVGRRREGEIATEADVGRVLAEASWPKASSSFTFCCHTDTESSDTVLRIGIQAGQTWYRARLTFAAVVARMYEGTLAAGSTGLGCKGLGGAD